MWRNFCCGKVTLQLPTEPASEHRDSYDSRMRLPSRIFRRRSAASKLFSIPANLSPSRNMIEIIGWASSIILLLTLIKQVYKQWKEGTSEGVSKCLFVGQLIASIGFTTYSYLVGN